MLGLSRSDEEDESMVNGRIELQVDVFTSTIKCFSGADTDCRAVIVNRTWEGRGREVVRS